jgi:serine phosphatase RsbU (regulator of sigma subunit)
VLGLFRRAAAVEAQLDAVAKAVDSALRSHLDEEDFVTAVFVEFTEGQVSVVNCGHYPPLRISGRGVETLAAAEPSPPLGLDPEFAIRSYSLDTDERLLVYTDGLIEARDPYGAFFDLEAPAALSLTQGTLDAALDTLVRRLLAHVGGRLNDDMALVLAQPVSADPGWRGRLSDPVPAEFG